MQFDTVAVVGVGLIGGSFALALKAAGAVRRVVGFGRRPENLALAQRLGVIDALASEPAAIAAADLVLFATPVGQMPALMQSFAPHLKPGALLTDAGSTKQDVVAAARQHLSPAIARFVPGHPIAGAESSGVDAARVNLFHHRDVILTPLAENSDADVERIANAWRSCGAQVSLLPPQTHDQVFGAVSHLPHVVAYALVDMLAKRDNSARLLSYAGAGFRDFTRIASSSPEMWRDICLANREALLAELLALDGELTEIRRLLEANDGEALMNVFSHARSARQQWLQAKGYGQE